MSSLARIYPGGVPPEAVDQLAGLLPHIPPQGFVYRGDTAMYANRSLAQLDNGYIFFTPPKEITPKTIAGCAIELREGIDYALQSAYPSRWSDQGAYITDKDFMGYAHYYRQHPWKLPVVTWAPAPPPKPGVPNCSFTLSRCSVEVGSTFTHGKIAPERTPPPARLDADDIKEAEREVIQRIRQGRIDSTWLEELRLMQYDRRHPHVPRYRSVGRLAAAAGLWVPFDGFAAQHEAAIVTSALIDYRAIRLMQAAIGDRIMKCLLEQVGTRWSHKLQEDSP